MTTGANRTPQTFTRQELVEQYELLYVKEGKNKDFAQSVKSLPGFKKKFRLKHWDDDDRGCIVLSGATIKDHPDEPTLGFSIKPVGTERIYLLVCESEVEKKEWKFWFDLINLQNKLDDSKYLNKRRREELQAEIQIKHMAIQKYQQQGMQESAYNETILKNSMEKELSDSVQRELTFESQISTLKSALVNSQNMKAIEQVTSIIDKLYTDLGGLDAVINQTRLVHDSNQTAKEFDRQINTSMIPEVERTRDQEADVELERITENIVQREDRMIEQRVALNTRNVRYSQDITVKEGGEKIGRTRSKVVSQRMSGVPQQFQQIGVPVPTPQGAPVQPNIYPQAILQQQYPPQQPRMSQQYPPLQQQPMYQQSPPQMYSQPVQQQQYPSQQYPPQQQQMPQMPQPIPQQHYAPQPQQYQQQYTPQNYASVALPDNDAPTPAPHQGVEENAVANSVALPN